MTTNNNVFIKNILVIVITFYKKVSKSCLMFIGCVANYDWNENNFDLLKNIIKQVVFAII